MSFRINIFERNGSKAFRMTRCLILYPRNKKLRDVTHFFCPYRVPLIEPLKKKTSFHEATLTIWHVNLFNTMTNPLNTVVYTNKYSSSKRASIK